MFSHFFGPSSAPEFTEGLDWINTGGRPVTLRELKGRVVLLDFWTYGCINCRHVQPRLKELERRFPDTLTVIGVHSGKFAHERLTPNLAAACDRQDVTHAVVNDRHYRIWRAYDVSAWPTTVLIDTGGKLLSKQGGEFSLETMTGAIEAAIAEGERDGTLVRGPEPTAVPELRAEGFLRYPGRVLVDGERLILSDTGHGRVLDCRLSREGSSVIDAQVIAEHPGFIEPQGLALHDGALLVADRAGQAVWSLGAGGERERILGTGSLAEGYLAGGFGPDLELRSPWGITVDGHFLVVSMAGSHQLWRLDLRSHKAFPWVGNGNEELTDGPLQGAMLGQPTGVTVIDRAVAFADSESSAIRIAEQDVGVRTVVGQGLFDFGDRDGVGGEVLLQHAEDLVNHGGVLCVTDTYNDRLKRIDPVSRECHPWPGEAGTAGALREPAGASSDGESLVVADTGNHRIVAVANDGALVPIRFEQEQVLSAAGVGQSSQIPL